MGILYVPHGDLDTLCMLLRLHLCQDWHYSEYATLVPKHVASTSSRPCKSFKVCGTQERVAGKIDSRRKEESIPQSMPWKQICMEIQTTNGYLECSQF